MERESFSDPEVAAAVNATFIAIKVDREERPDIDGIYMTVCQAMTGSGGWPLTIFMTPEQKPFFAGTYFPKRSSFGRIGFLELTKKIHELWRTRRGELLAVAAHNLAVLKEAEEKGATVGCPRLFWTGDLPNWLRPMMNGTAVSVLPPNFPLPIIFFSCSVIGIGPERKRPCPWSAIP